MELWQLLRAHAVKLFHHWQHMPLGVIHPQGKTTPQQPACVFAILPNMTKKIDLHILLRENLKAQNDYTSAPDFTCVGRKKSHFKCPSRKFKHLLSLTHTLIILCTDVIWEQKWEGSPYPPPNLRQTSPEGAHMLLVASGCYLKGKSNRRHRLRHKSVALNSPSNESAVLPYDRPKRYSERFSATCGLEPRDGIFGGHWGVGVWVGAGAWHVVHLTNLGNASLFTKCLLTIFVPLKGLNPPPLPTSKVMDFLLNFHQKGLKQIANTQPKLRINPPKKKQNCEQTGVPENCLFSETKRGVSQECTPLLAVALWAPSAGCISLCILSTLDRDAGFCQNHPFTKPSFLGSVRMFSPSTCCCAWRSLLQILTTIHLEFLCGPRVKANHGRRLWASVVYIN